MRLGGSSAVGGGFSLIEDRETGILRALLIAPLTRISILFGKIAARLGVPVETVRTRVKRARERLREKLVEEHGSRKACLVSSVP